MVNLSWHFAETKTNMVTWPCTIKIALNIKLRINLTSIYEQFEVFGGEFIIGKQPLLAMATY